MAAPLTILAASARAAILLRRTAIVTLVLPDILLLVLTDIPVRPPKPVLAAQLSVLVTNVTLRRLVTILIRRQVVRHNAKMLVRRLVLKTAQRIMKAVEAVSAQADRPVLTGPAYLLHRRAVIAVGIALVGIAGHHILMTAIARIVMK